MSVVSLVFPSMLLDTLDQADGGFEASLYTGYLPIAFWASLSSCMHHGIACLAFQAYDWPSACWSSLSGINPSMTFVSLAMIGHCSDHMTEPLNGSLIILASTWWLIAITELCLGTLVGLLPITNCALVHSSNGIRIASGRLKT